ncbi:MAG: bifunctional phosphopantothenoylcysteine decarboxylase/phosphopantothenate--cysteine ligase CoaBC [Planctomycetota bacterium]
MACLTGKKIILGVSGGIAAYKSCDLVSRLVKAGASVQVVMTKNACKFITPYTFEALTGQPCLTTLFRRIKLQDTPFSHIEPVRNADLVIIAPATANLMAKLAHGLADDLLSTLMLSVRCQALICPAMNVQMWEHPATQANVKTLKSYGYKLLGPDIGHLACGMHGAGRLVEPSEIVKAACRALKSLPKCTAHG